MVEAVVGGLIAGIIARFLVGRKASGGLIADIVVGLLGGVAGKYLLSVLSLPQVGDPVVNLMIAAGGATILLVIYHTLIDGTLRSTNYI